MARRGSPWSRPPNPPHPRRTVVRSCPERAFDCPRTRTPSSDTNTSKAAIARNEASSFVRSLAGSLATARTTGLSAFVKGRRTASSDRGIRAAVDIRERTRPYGLSVTDEPIDFVISHRPLIFRTSWSAPTVAITFPVTTST